MPQKTSTRGYIPLPTITDSTPLQDCTICLFACQVIYLSAMSPNVLVMITVRCHIGQTSQSYVYRVKQISVQKVIQRRCTSKVGKARRRQTVESRVFKQHVVRCQQNHNFVFDFNCQQMNGSVFYVFCLGEFCITNISLTKFYLSSCSCQAV